MNENWVEAKGNCSLLVGFDKLREIAVQNIKERNKDSPQVKEAARHHLFALLDARGNNFSVKMNQQADADAEEMSVRFSLKKDHILITTEQGKELVVGVNLNDELQCVYTIDGEGEYLGWQIARMALENLFFGKHMHAVLWW